VLALLSGAGLTDYLPSDPTVPPTGDSEKQQPLAPTTPSTQGPGTPFSVKDGEVSSDSDSGGALEGKRLFRSPRPLDGSRGEEFRGGRAEDQLAGCRGADSPASSSSSSCPPHGPPAAADVGSVPCGVCGVVAAASSSSSSRSTASASGARSLAPRRPSSSRSDRALLIDPHATEIAYFRLCVQVEFKPWVPGDFTIVSRLAKSVHGEVRYLEKTDGTSVVAKVAPAEAVAKGKERAGTEQRAWFGSTEAPLVEDLWNEIAVLTYLEASFETCPYLIRLQGIFQDTTSTYLVTDYCDGGELFERVAYGEPLPEQEKRRYVSQLLQAVRHLHRHNVGHRDVSLENVLLRKGDCVLMDFGQAVRLRAIDGTPMRYYAEAGKRMYRAPEMYVPRERPIQVVCPTDGKPGAVVQVPYDRCRCEVLLPAGAVPGKPCMAEPHGYSAAPSDVFACGVCAFVIVEGKPPWAVARDMDPTFSFIRRHGVPMLLQQWRGEGSSAPGAPPSDEVTLLAQMLRADPAKRAGVDECLVSPWLSSVAPARFRSQTT